MKITVINGNARHGSTWHCKEQLLNEFARHQSTEVTEFTLPKDMPHFCQGCFTCFMKGEDACPHASSVAPIAKALVDSDIIVLASPVYALDISGQMKALLDHLCYMWVSHRPDPKMFNKVGIVVTTTAGAGLSHSVKTLKNSLDFWGVKRTYIFKNPVSAMKWDEVPSKKKQKIERNAVKLAEKAERTSGKIERIPQRPMFKFLFMAMRGMQKKNEWNPQDRNHWEAQGWLK